MRRTTLVLVLAGLIAIAAPHVYAHHSFSAEFDANKPIKVTGTVTKLEWQNPHAWFYVDVKDEGGATSNWGFELATPNVLLRFGWTRSTIGTGDVVTVEGYQAKNGKPIANASAVTLERTGQKLFTGPGKGGDK